MRFARDVAGHIKTNLVDRFAAVQMRQALDTSIPAANDILKAAAQIYGARRWLTAQSSANINTIYEYFAVYQLRLAILLTNYEASVEGFSAERVQAEIRVIEENIARQKADRLKPPVPDDKFVDTRHMQMWDRKPVWVQGQGYQPHEDCTVTSRGTLSCRLNDPTSADQRCAHAQALTAASDAVTPASGRRKKLGPRAAAHSDSSSAIPSTSSPTFSTLKTVPFALPSISHSQNAGQKSNP